MLPFQHIYVDIQLWASYYYKVTALLYLCYFLKETSYF
jgi:hypothetical protein